VHVQSQLFFSLFPLDFPSGKDKSYLHMNILKLHVIKISS
jgi:hypothetical protein